MTTINISLPSTQAELVDSLVLRFNFANRSEFFRALLRKITIDAGLLHEAVVYPFVSPKTKSKKEIMKAFAKSGRYSKGFLADLKEGLDDSSYFK